MKNAKLDMMAAILGIIMIVAGIFYFLTKIRITSVFFTGGENWPLWYSFISLIPMIAGIVLMLVFRDKWWPRIVAIAGTVLVFVAIANQTTLHLRTRLVAHQWAMIGILVIGGLAVVGITLFVQKKESNEKR